MKTDELQLPTACKRHSPAAGATQGYDRLHTNRQAVKKPNFNIYLQKNNAKISLEFASACLPESIFQTAIFC
jgi:hypothetical protein